MTSHPAPDGHAPKMVGPDPYGQVLEELKDLVRAAQVRAHRTVNIELIRLYWQIGNTILTRQEHEGWGAKVVARLARDLRSEFPSMKGLSRSNLNYMRAFAAAFPDETIFQQAAGKLPWGHLMVLLDKVDQRPVREWYASQAISNGWSRAVLTAQIASEAHLRLGSAPSNFTDRLPSPESDLAQQMVKDPYVFEFLRLTEHAAERDLEDQLVTHLQSTLLELGRGFAFVGRQYRFEIGGDEFFIDLLLFNWLHNRFLVVELKVGRFRPEHTGQLNLYVQWVDRHLRQPHHAETVGLLLCADRNDEVVKLALGGTTAPMAVADWKRPPPGLDLRAGPEIEAIVTAVEESGPLQLTLHDYFSGRRQP